MRNKVLAILAVMLLSLVALAGISRSYSTTFPFSESAISEGGMWLSGHRNGSVWADVRTYPGKAFGLEGWQTTGNYSDASAVLAGVWNPSQAMSGTVYTTSSVPKAGYPCYPEVELRLHTSISPYSIKGYEVNFAVEQAGGNAYGMIVRWNGGLGNFTVLRQYYGSTYGVRNGDKVYATYSNGKITAYKNGVAIMSAYDTTYQYSGAPGIGFNYGVRSCPVGYGHNDSFGYTSFQATD